MQINVTEQRLAGKKTGLCSYPDKFRDTLFGLFLIFNGRADPEIVGHFAAEQVEPETVEVLGSLGKPEPVQVFAVHDDLGDFAAHVVCDVRMFFADV
jgi:hypothetical protein